MCNTFSERVKTELGVDLYYLQNQLKPPVSPQAWGTSSFLEFTIFDLYPSMLFPLNLGHFPYHFTSQGLYKQCCSLFLGVWWKICLFYLVLSCWIPVWCMPNAYRIAWNKISAQLTIVVLDDFCLFLKLYTPALCLRTQTHRTSHWVSCFQSPGWVWSIDETRERKRS